MRAPLLFVLATAGWLAGVGLVFTGCSRHGATTRVEQGNRDGVLHLGNFGEPRELDPALAVGIPETHLLYAFYEGLVRADGTDLHPTPGVAESWEVSPDGLTYTFHLREDARWSNGEALTAKDFVGSWQRVLSPKLAGELSYYLWVIKNAEAYNKSQLTDFTQVGVHALDPRTLRVDLEHPTPYFFRLIFQRFFFPVYLPGIAKLGKDGDVTERGNQRWTRPENFVGNGPYTLAAWEVNQQIVAKKNPQYWNAGHIRINEVHYYPIDNGDAEEQAFRAGLLHKTSSGNVSSVKLGPYRQKSPELVHLDPYLGTYFYLFNTTKPPLDDVRVRRALAMSIDRESLVKNVTRNGERAAYFYTPPGTADYLCRARIPYDPEGARKLLAEAGHPGGKGLPPLDILLNTSDLHRQLAEAVQQMWQKELGVEVRLNNQEWKVYLDSRRTMTYTICRAGWIGSLDPSFFLDNYLTGGTNNQTGFTNPEYDRLITETRRTADPAARNEKFQQAEAILLDAAPIAPVYFYTNSYLLRPSVRGWHANPVDYHPFEELSLQP